QSCHAGSSADQGQGCDDFAGGGFQVETHDRFPFLEARETGTLLSDVLYFPAGFLGSRKVPASFSRSLVKDSIK
ncbi:hypothetical protein AB4068_14990, partial [Arthrobacter sp. 2RAF22]|uniref:hypothetical protein n=1 Tax=Arthrobacter sp. 2RAF22 TaxID=3232996 RepID=UPI003F904D67